MLRFLSLLFNSPEDRAGLDDALIEKAIERVVAGTDRRLCALGGYQERLRKPVELSILHVISLVDALPPPVEISPQGFSEDNGLRAFFVSIDHLHEVLGKFGSVRDYLTELTEPPDEIFGLLTMVKEERNVFGMELEGDSLRRDVMQTAVNFFNHRYLEPTSNELHTRRELKKRAFDFLVEKTLERLSGERIKRTELDRQRFLLKQKLATMKAGHWGLDMMMGDDDGQLPDLAALEAEINAIDAELGQFQTDKLSLQESLDIVVETLSRPADWLASRKMSLRVDYRGVKVADTSTASSTEINLTEIFSSTGESRTVLLGRIARADIPEPTDFWKVAKRYL